MEDTSYTFESNPVVEAVVAPRNNAVEESSRRRGRPKISVQWPEGRFTFELLQTKNVLSASSLRKKMRVELKRGGLVKVDTLKTAFGRPQNIYEKA
jgi:hypothetical protein